ncbi:MAG: hypothetical protein JXQ73_21885 [Phycisphaerae bacterium]|nr:hypothetical protein [Phycisphaerae bacterium]
MRPTSTTRPVCSRAPICLLAIAAIATTAQAAQQPEILDSGLTPRDVEKRPYADYVRQCVDLLIQYGTDRYGPVQRPTLMAILDVRTRQCPPEPLPLDEQWRVIRRGRRAPGGANLYLDQPTYLAITELARRTGDEKYSAFVRQSLDHYLTQLVDDKGLIWWGFHRHYDAHKDVMTGHQGNHHEIHIQQAVWPILWNVNPKAVTREIDAVWKWHVIDKKTGEVNRHADGQRGCDFAMTGGEIVYAFAFMHTKTGDAKWLDRAKLIADYYWQRRDPKTNLVPNRPNAGRDRFDGSHFDTSVAGLLCHRLLAAYELTRETAFRDQAVAYLTAYANYGYDAKTRQFWGSLNLDGSPVPAPRVPDGYAAYEPRGHIDLWEPYFAGYEFPLYAAQTYAYAYELTKNELMLVTAKRWYDAIRSTWPPNKCNQNTWYAGYAKDWAPHGTYAGLYGRTISFALQLHALTGDQAYRDFARAAADEAVAKLYYKGLFRGHPRKPYYEAVDGVGYLLQALLQLDQPPKKSP